jgi:predicted nucleotidyltransferase
MKVKINSFVKPLIDVLEREKIQYAIIGGLAVMIYGEPRFTKDVDINIILEKGKIKDFIKKLQAKGFSPSLYNAVQIAETSGYLQVSYNTGKNLTSFDIIIAENPIEFSAIERAKIKKIDGMNIKMITPEDLIIQKITSEREKDKNDLIGIIARQEGKMDLDYIRNWLTKIDKVLKNTSLTQEFNKVLKNISS